MSHAACKQDLGVSGKEASHGVALIGVLVVGLAAGYGLSEWVHAASANMSSDVQSVVPEDWHGNVMRSHWRP